MRNKKINESEIDAKEMIGATKEDNEELQEEKSKNTSDRKVLIYTLIIFIIIAVIIGPIVIYDITHIPDLEYPDYDNYSREEQNVIVNGTSLPQITYENEGLNVFIIEVQFDNYSLHKAGWYNANDTATNTIYIKSPEELYLYLKIFYFSILTEEQLNWFNNMCLIALR